MLSLRTLACAGLALTLGCASAQLQPESIHVQIPGQSVSGQGMPGQGIQPQSIVVNPLPNPHADFQVDVTLDKSYYAIGERLSVSVRTTQDAYIYLFNINSVSQLTMLLPNGYPGGHDNFIRAGQVRRFPTPDSNFDFTVKEPAGGIDQVIVLATRAPIDTNGVIGFAQGGFATRQLSVDAFARSLSVAINPLSQNSWVTDIAYFQVIAQPIFQPPTSPTYPPVNPSFPIAPAPPLHPVNPSPLPGHPSGSTLSSCAQLTLPHGIEMRYLNDRAYSSDAILYTLEDLRNVYMALLRQLQARGFHEVTFDADFPQRRLEASLRGGSQQYDIVLDREGQSGTVNFVLFCNY